MSSPSDAVNFVAGPRYRLHPAFDTGNGRDVFHLADQRCPLCDVEDALPKGPDMWVTHTDPEAGTITLGMAIGDDV